MRIIVLAMIGAAVVACGAEMEGASAPGADTRPDAVPQAPAPSSAPKDAEEAEPGISLSAKVGGRTLETRHEGECKHAAQAYIYGTRSAMWMVTARRAGEIQQMRLTAWRPQAGGADQLNLRLRLSSGGEYDIDTVTGDGSVAGSAKVTVEPRGEGGRLVVDGRTADGTPLHLTIDCARFAGIEAEGG